MDELTKVMDYQLGLMKDRLKLFETDLAQMKKTIENKSNNNHASGCVEDWFPYSDTKCYKVLDKKGSELEAKGNCSQLESSSTLITIHSKEEQNFLSNRLKDYENISDFVWIGLEFVDKAFQWMDRNELKFENWGENAIKDGHNKCVQMSLGKSELGKWTDDMCQKKYQIICQKKQTTESVISNEVKKLTKVIEELKQNQISSLNLINAQRKELYNLNHDHFRSLNLIIKQRKELDHLKQNPVPIGFIYVQMSGQLEPHNLWPGTNWNNISPNYAGSFFRAEGGKAAEFGWTQYESTRSLQIISSYCKELPNNKESYAHAKAIDPYIVDTDFHGSPFWTGSNYGSKDDDRCINFKYTTNENRPRNEAIRIWIRIE